ncbi:hypothetical protein [Chryseobacterium sp. 22543]|uniref:hypothetical protein n=1 Tax=Chryseobacterium sp. 22543 TaxID=3453940 RepID=UPI003F87D932
MTITDLNGHSIEVTNLTKAINQAKTFKGFQHKDKIFSDFDKRNKAYWTDIYNKLMEIRKQLQNTSK